MIDHNYGVRLSKDIDFNDALTCRNNPVIRNWCRENDDISPDTQKKWAESLTNNNSLRMYAVTDNYGSLTTDPIQFGVCGLTNINWYHRTAEWSLYIDPKYQGKGYAYKALLTLLHHGFMSLNLNRIYGEIFYNNLVCLNLAFKIGFKVEGTLRQTYYKNGRYINSVIESMLKDEFIAIYIDSEKKEIK